MRCSQGDYYKRGFFYGPWLPIYGVGGVLFHLILNKKKKHFLPVFFLSMLIASCVELVVGWFTDNFWGLNYWDYSSYPLNFHGYICIGSALGFGLAGVLWVSFLSDFIAKFWFRFSSKKRRNLNTLLILLFVFDCAAALIFPNTGTGITFP